MYTFLFSSCRYDKTLADTSTTLATQWSSLTEVERDSFAIASQNLRFCYLITGFRCDFVSVLSIQSCKSVHKCCAGVSQSTTNLWRYVVKLCQLIWWHFSEHVPFKAHLFKSVSYRMPYLWKWFKPWTKCTNSHRLKTLGSNSGTKCSFDLFVPWLVCFYGA